MNSPAPLWLRLAAWLSVALWAATIHFFSSLTGPEIEQVGITIWDKAAHFIAFAAGGVALALALNTTVFWPRKKQICVAVIALVLYGAFDEFHQRFTPFRTGADPLDWLADALGAMVGVALFTMIYARFSRAYPPAPARA